MNIPSKYFNVEEFAVVVEEIIDEIAIETELHIDVVLGIICDYYDMTLDDIKWCLSKIESKFTTINRVIGYIDGKAQRRTAESMAMVRIIEHIGQKITRDFEIETNEEISTIIDVIENTYKHRRKNNDRCGKS